MSNRTALIALVVTLIIGLFVLRPSLVGADNPVHNPDTDGNYVNAPATRAQADLLILHGGHYVLGRGHYLFDDDALAIEAMNVAKHMTGKGWHRTYEDEGNGPTFIGAYNETTGAAIGIEVSGKWTLSVRPIFYGPNG